jgi:hypothetical protein
MAQIIYVSPKLGQLKFELAKGLFKYKTSKHSQSLDKPIVACELFFNGVIKQVNMFDKNLNDMNGKHGKDERHLKKIKSNSLPTIYIGKYDKQYYAQFNNLFENNKNDNINLLTNNQMYLSRKLLKTKSTCLSSQDDENGNSLVLYKNTDIVSNNALSTTDGTADDDSSSELGGWFFIESDNSLSSFTTYIHMSFTVNQMLVFLITLLSILIATYFFIIKKLVEIHEHV